MKKKKKLVSLLVGGIVIAACKTHPEAVNSQRDLPIVAALPPGRYEGNASQPKTAIAGKVLLISQFPIPLSKVRIGLWRIHNGEKKMIHEFSTNPDGSFQITRPIERGSYELQVTDPRYEGVYHIRNLEQPETEIIFEVQKR